MHVYFWGTRGSLPASITAETVRAKIIKAIKEVDSRQLTNDEEIEQFVDHKLPFPVRGAMGVIHPVLKSGAAKSMSSVTQEQDLGILATITQKWWSKEDKIKMPYLIY